MSEYLFLLVLRLLNYVTHCVGESRPSEIGGGGGGTAVSKNFFSALRASVWSTNKRGRAPPLDPPLLCFKSK